MRLEGLVGSILRQTASDIFINPSQVDHLLAIIQQSGQAKVYINELPLCLSIRAKQSISAGTAVTIDNIADIQSLTLGVNDIPPDAAVVFLFSIGWRKGLYYDLGPLSATEQSCRTYDLGCLLGQLWAHVLFQERFALLDGEWDTLFDKQWFPFITLRKETLHKMFDLIRSNWDIDEIIPDVVKEVKAVSDSMLDGWRRHEAFVPHMPVLELIIKHFHDGDYVSCVHLAFTRIEGIMRTYRQCRGFSKGERLEVSIIRGDRDRITPLLPQRFEHYLKEVYFKNFNPDEPTPELSRHSVAHGCIDASLCSAKASVIGILIINQLFYFGGNSEK